MPAKPDQGEWPAILRAMEKTVAAMLKLSAEGRNTVLCGLLAQEVCTLPPGERSAAMGEIVAELPAILRSTEEGMRLQLTENARRGL